MRPSDITDGNTTRRVGRNEASLGGIVFAAGCFNEAVGYYRRKQWPVDGYRIRPPRSKRRFNEAVGYYRRKHRRNPGNAIKVQEFQSLQ